MKSKHISEPFLERAGVGGGGGAGGVQAPAHTGASFSSRQQSRGAQVPAAPLTWAAYFQVALVPKCTRGLRQSETERGRGSRTKLAPDTPPG